MLTLYLLPYPIEGSKFPGLPVQRRNTPLSYCGSAIAPSLGHFTVCTSGTTRASVDSLKTWPDLVVNSASIR